MKILLLIILCSASGILYSQIDTVATVTYTEKMPAFPGGQTEMYRYIYVNMKYPPLALKNKIKGVVHVQFVVTETGEITNTTVTRGVSHDLDEEAVRIIETMNENHKWEPGLHNGKPVPIAFTLPIKFHIQ